MDHPEKPPNQEYLGGQVMQVIRQGANYARGWPLRTRNMMAALSKTEFIARTRCEARIELENSLNWR